MGKKIRSYDFSVHGLCILCLCGIFVLSIIVWGVSTIYRYCTRPLIVGRSKTIVTILTIAHMRSSKSLNINNLESLVNFIDGVNKEFRILLMVAENPQNKTLIPHF